jgi:hypothetical protein
MSQIVADVKERLWLAELWLHEKWETVGLDRDGSVPDVLNDEEKKAIDLLASLHDGVDAVPASLVSQTDELRQAAPHVFEKVACSLAGAVGFGYYPSDATAFVRTLNENIEHVTARLESTIHDRACADA